MLAHCEKQILLNKLDDKFAKIKALVTDAVDEKEIHDFEKDLFKQILELGCSCLDAFVKQHGTGYEKENPPHNQQEEKMEYKGTFESSYLSIFGEIKINRAGYDTKGEGYYYPLDKRLNLPEKKYSYLLQRWIKSRDVETDFREAAASLNEIFGFDLSCSVPLRLGENIAAHVADFYENKPLPEASTEGSHMAISVDGKGVRIVPSERRTKPDTDPANKTLRGQQESKGVKKECVVTAAFTFYPEPRDPEEIVNNLIQLNQEKDKDQEKLKEKEQESQQASQKDKPRTPLNKHLRAHMDGKKQALDYIIKHALQRDPGGEKDIIFLMDGDRYLIRDAERAIKEHKISARVDAFILDILHGSRYVWEAGEALHGQGLERTVWVREKLLAILEGKVGRVIGGLRQIMTKNALTKAQEKKLNTSITYFENHKHMMKYDEYLSKGYMIGTGLIEAACGSLVKDRMEQSGMRWTIKGAQNVLELRAIKQNGDWEAFWHSYLLAKKQSLYPDDYRNCMQKVA